MSMIKALCYQVYEWNKRDFWLLTLFSIGSTTLFQIFDAPILLQITVVILIFFKTIFFIKSASIMPSLGADNSQFSWKYLQSLPLNKRDLIVFLIISNLFVMSPLLIWFMSFQVILVVQLFEVKNYNFSTGLHLLFFITSILMFITVLTIKALIQSTRRQFARKHEKTLFLQRMRNLIFIFNALVYGLIGMYFLNEITQIDIIKIISIAINKGFALLIDSPFFPLVLITLLWLSVKATIRIWQNEELSYTKINWKPRRDIPVTLFAVVMLYIPLSNIPDFDSHFATHEILQEISSGNEVAVQSYIKSGKELNFKNKYGITPTIAAAMNGRLNILRLLEKSGASRNGILKFGKKSPLTGANILMAAVADNHHNTVKYLLETGESANVKNAEHNFYPIHMAAKKCSARLIDMMIENGADVKAVNAVGETALHVATRYKCLASMVSLQEAGLDPLIKNNKGEIALDYLGKKHVDQNTRYYLEKISRVPASKGSIERAEDNDNK